MTQISTQCQYSQPEPQINVKQKSFWQNLEECFLDVFVVNNWTLRQDQDSEVSEGRTALSAITLQLIIEITSTELRSPMQKFRENILLMW